MQEKDAQNVVISVLTRSWIAFCIFSTVGFSLELLREWENPLRSDDPYLIGFLCAGIAVSLVIVYTLFSTAAIIYWVPLLGWCLFCIVADFYHTGEGQGIFTILGILSFLIGSLLYLVCFFAHRYLHPSERKESSSEPNKMHLPAWFLILISSLGVLFWVGFSIVAMRL